MRAINRIIIHASDTPPQMDIGVKEIRQWHVDPPPLGNGWTDIGYHIVIRRDGTEEPGRPIARIGAHARGFNHDSIGICLVGGMPDCNFTFFQYIKLVERVAELCATYGVAKSAVCGHRDVDTQGKTCPTFSVASLFEGIDIEEPKE